MEEGNLLAGAKRLGDFFRDRFDKLKQECNIIQEVRVLGVMVGVELTVDGAPVVQKCLERKLLTNCTQGRVIRLLPAMNLTMEQAEEGCQILEDVLKSVAAE